MNHSKIYHSIIEPYRSIKTRKEGLELHGYVERHHIIPTCVGGPDTDANQVYLPARVHFVVHRILVKVYPGNADLWLALKIMSQGKRSGLYKFNARTFAQIREKCAEANRGRKMSPEARAKMSIASKRQVHTEERRRKCSETQKGRKKTVEQCLKNSLAQRGKTHSEETKQKLSKSLTGRNFSEEHRRNLALSRIGKKHNSATILKIKNGNLGKVMSEEAKRKISASNIGKSTGRKHSEETLAKMRTPRKKTRERLGLVIQ